MRGTYRGYDIVSMPLPSSGGTVLLQTLNILEGFPIADTKQGGAPSLHRDLAVTRADDRPRGDEVVERVDLLPTGLEASGDGDDLAPGERHHFPRDGAANHLSAGLHTSN